VRFLGLERSKKDNNMQSISDKEKPYIFGINALSPP
jgi:hypothetical protein